MSVGAPNHSFEFERRTGSSERQFGGEVPRGRPAEPHCLHGDERLHTLSEVDIPNRHSHANRPPPFHPLPADSVPGLVPHLPHYSHKWLAPRWATIRDFHTCWCVNDGAVWDPYRDGRSLSALWSLRAHLVLFSGERRATTMSEMLMFDQEEQIIDRCRMGDRTAFGQLYQKYKEIGRAHV